ncbi:MAG: hypothetical protein JWL65_2843 [Gammaproteobacteria bacterium]|nr:hypothetical protein [Gammaproteobacteria bacterium]
MDNEDTRETGESSPAPALVPPHVDREDPNSMRDWVLRRAQRALGFARQMLREATEDAVKGGAHERVRYSTERAAINADRAFGRLHRELRRLRSLRVYQWVSWPRGSEVPTVLYGEARTLPEAKEGAQRDLKEIEGVRFYSHYSDRDGVALVTGPSGARYELRRTYSAKVKGRYLGFRWHARGREVTCRRVFAAPRAVSVPVADDASGTDAGN